MDTTGDEDVKLERNAVNLIHDFQQSLSRFLFKSRPAQHSPHNVRRLVRQSKANQLIRLLEPFQEWPQLLDPHLATLLPPLVSAFLAYISKHAGSYHDCLRNHASPDIIPLPRALCKIIYTFCKIRGAKVICQFMNNEPKHLEPMLDTFEDWASGTCSSDKLASSDHGIMVWEERYVMLLWLSHLTLTPFDLASISSSSAVAKGRSSSIDLRFPALPALTRRLISIAINHLEMVSKEREAAKALLVRLAVRPDMKSTGLQSWLIERAITILEPDRTQKSTVSLYAAIGNLSFIAGFLISADKNAVKPFLFPVFLALQRHVSGESSWTELNLSATVRKICTKISRALAVIGLQMDSLEETPSSCLGEDGHAEIIDHLLNALADKDTSVRIAASKALSVVATHHEPDMAAQIVEQVLDDLNENVVFEDTKSHQKVAAGLNLPAHESQSITGAPGFGQRNLNAVNPSRWHGLTLSLSHLLYRRSMPKEVIPRAVDSLILALGFEQRSSLGTSVGTNVRDAACFGLWAMARRYTTQELCGTHLFTYLKQPQSENSALQTMANELIAAATLDTSGNIRRGASAALQEMVGRHPETIKSGIWLVQTVDYHAVALRSRAMHEVAVTSSTLDEVYWHAVFQGLLDWRGIRSHEAQYRRDAAEVIGQLAINRVKSIVKVIRDRLYVTHQAEERHGLIMTLSSVILAARKSSQEDDKFSGREVTDLWHSLLIDGLHLSSHLQRENSIDQGNVSSNRGLDSDIIALISEAICSLISALALMISDQTSSKDRTFWPSKHMLRLCTDIINISIRHKDQKTASATSGAAAALFPLLTAEDQESIVLKWKEILISNEIETRGLATGLVGALCSVFRGLGPSERTTSSSAQSLNPMQAVVAETLTHLLTHDRSVELRSSCLRDLTSKVIPFHGMTSNLLNAIHASLSDYTNDQRGDVGSLVRLQAIDAAATALASKDTTSVLHRQNLTASICSLAVEKLDKVRFRASGCLQSNWIIFSLHYQPPLSVQDISQTTTEDYFRHMLSLCSEAWLRPAFFEGYITSAGAGSESVLRASRAALASYTSTLSPDDLETHCIHLIDIMHRNPKTDRLLVPCMDLIAFLLDVSILQHLKHHTSFPWRELFNLTQAAHYKSGNMHKIETAVKIYAHMVEVPCVKNVAMRKLGGLLLHPYPTIRNKAADELFIAVEDETLLGVDWSRPVAELKAVVQDIRERLTGV